MERSLVFGSAALSAVGTRGALKRNGRRMKNPPTNRPRNSGLFQYLTSIRVLC